MLRKSIIPKLLLLFIVLFVFAFADFRYLMRVDQYKEKQKLSLELENRLADLQVQHSQLYHMDLIRERILSDEKMQFRPASENEIIRWNP